MESSEFLSFRKRLSKTQKQMSQILGTSIKAIHSYEQGWRKIPVHVERQIYFLATRIKGTKKGLKPCWIRKNCPFERRSRCPAWEFQIGDLCWFINGTICEGVIQKDWREKMRICRKCEVFKSAL